jgi:hypothetical protein
MVVSSVERVNLGGKILRNIVKFFTTFRVRGGYERERGREGERRGGEYHTLTQIQ